MSKLSMGTGGGKKRVLDPHNFRISPHPSFYQGPGSEMSLCGVVPTLLNPHGPMAQSPRRCGQESHGRQRPWPELPRLEGEERK